MLKWLKGSIFRQLNLWIGLSLLFIFIMLGTLTYYNYYNLILNREQELLSYRTKKTYEDFKNTLEQFKRETSSIYTTSAIGITTQGTYTQGINNYFIPSKIPEAPNSPESAEQVKGFVRFLTAAATRTPTAVDLSFYRTADDSFYHIGKYLPYGSTDWKSFFTSIPQSFGFPFIDTFKNKPTEKVGNMLYVINPIFDYNAILPDKAYGFFMMVFDPVFLYNNFKTGTEDGERVVVLHKNTVLLDSNPEAALSIPQLHNGHLVESIPLPLYDLTIIGLKDKSAIKTPLNKIEYAIILILLFSWVVCILSISFIQRIFAKRLQSLVNHFRRIQQDPFVKPLQATGTDEISFLITRYNQMTSQLQEYIQSLSVITMQKHNAEYYALKMQINPHFLYNTLESLRMQAITAKQLELSEKLFTLGKLFRRILKPGDEVISLKEELQHTEYYLDLFNLGKTNRIEVQVEHSEQLSHIFILKFSLQPIIENAIMHGSLEVMKSPIITIRTYQDHFHQYIELRNNGIGITHEQWEQMQADLEKPGPLNQGEHVGLKNVHERIRTYYGGAYGLSILSLNPTEGFGLVIKLPLQQHRS